MTKATQTKASLENKHLGNGDYFVMIASSSYSLLLTEQVNVQNERFNVVRSRCR